MLTLETLTEEQKEFLQGCNDGEFNKQLDFKIISTKSKYVEYGDQLCTVKFFHDGTMYECAYVFETGPATYDWDNENAAAEDCYLEVLPPKEAPERKPFLIAVTQLYAGGARVTLKNVPAELHDRIIEKHGSYSEMQEEAENNYNDTLMEEFLNSPSVQPFETFQEESE